MSTDDAVALAYSLLVRLQSAIDDGDLATLSDLFSDDAVVVGTATHSHGREQVDAYLAALLHQPGTFRWEWHDVVVFHEGPGNIGCAAFGELIVSGADTEDHIPFRVTFSAVDGVSGWRFTQFHGSVPASG
jgi:uncharacterized protein (TIGR02246 family)